MLCVSLNQDGMNNGRPLWGTVAFWMIMVMMMSPATLSGFWSVILASDGAADVPVVMLNVE